jgi:glycosyltransferase involved in cell wall biosynthesis
MKGIQYEKTLPAIFPASSRPLRIAQVAPLYESVPPKLYGGTERIVAYLAEELVRRGHEVSLYAAGDSTTSVPVIAGSPQSLRLSGLDHLGPIYHLPMLSDVYDNTNRFDIIHSHVDCLSFPLARRAQVPTVSTMHGRLDLKEMLPIYRSYKDLPVVSISDDQRRPIPDLNWVRTVYHGLPRDVLRFSPKTSGYLAFLGRICPEKRPDLAIEIARCAGVPLKIAAKVDRNDRDYFETVIKPLLSSPGIEFIGEINETEKQPFLGGALALLFPVDWPEPFGLVMIEALACGTPVIARPCGSVTEVLRHGVTGFIGSSLEELIISVDKISDISRQHCRDEFESRFTSEVMAANYEHVYCHLAEMNWKTHRTAAWPKRPVADAALARDAAHQWHPTVSRDGLNGQKKRGSVRSICSANYRESAQEFDNLVGMHSKERRFSMRQVQNDFGQNNPELQKIDQLEVLCPIEDKS